MWQRLLFHDFQTTFWQIGNDRRGCQTTVRWLSGDYDKGNALPRVSVLVFQHFRRLKKFWKMKNLEKPDQKIWRLLLRYSLCCIYIFIKSCFFKVYFYLKPWPNDQTLFVKYLKFASQTKCLTVWPNHKTLLAKHFLLVKSRNSFIQKYYTAFACQTMAKRSNIACKQCLKCLTMFCRWSRP